MRARKTRRRNRCARRQATHPFNRSNPQRSLRFQALESRQLLAADIGGGDPIADITGLWITVGNREYFTSEQASVQVDVFAGESLQVTGIRYDLSEEATPDHGVIAFESYVRREHGAAETGSFDYANGRFAHPVPESPIGGETVLHPGFESGWNLEVIDNRVAVVAVRYFEDSFVVEDRMLFDVNVVNRDETTTWTEAADPKLGVVDPATEQSEDETAIDSRDDGRTGLTVIPTGTVGSERYEIGVKAKTIEENTYANGFVVVDYRSEDDFIYAGLRSIADRWVIGHFDGKFNDLASFPQDIQPQQVYDLRVAVDGAHVALAADGVFRVSHDFDAPLKGGSIGLANQFAYTHFTDFHYFDNSSIPADPASAELALMESQELAELADQASEQAAGAAQEAHMAWSDAEMSAQEAQQLADAAEMNVAAAMEHHRTVRQELQEAKDKNTARELDEAKKKERSANKLVQRSQQRKESAEKLSGQLAKKLDQTRENESKILVQHEHHLREQHEAHLASAEADQAAENARAVADAAAQAAKDAKQGTKEERKAADNQAREAKRIADAAESTAKQQRKRASRADAAVKATTQQLANIREKIDRIASQHADALAQVSEAEASVESARVAFNAAEQDRMNAETAHAENQRLIDELRDAVKLAATEMKAAESEAKLARREARTARRLADEALRFYENLQKEAERLAEEADLARQEVTGADETLRLLLSETSADGLGIDVGTDHVYSLNFNHQDDGAFETVVGDSELVAGQIHLIPEAGDAAIAVLDESALPERTETRVYTTIRADELPGKWQNGFVVFDYESADNFKYAGAWAGADRWAIGEVIDGEWEDTVAVDEVIEEGPAYELQIWIEDDTLSLLVEGVQKLQHEFSEAIDDGQLGIASTNARSRFDQVAVMQLVGGIGDAGIDELPEDEVLRDMF